MPNNNHPENHRFPRLPQEAGATAVWVAVILLSAIKDGHPNWVFVVAGIAHIAFMITMNSQPPQE